MPPLGKGLQNLLMVDWQARVSYAPFSSILYTRIRLNLIYTQGLYAGTDQDMPRQGIKLRPLNVDIVLKDKVYDALKNAILSMDIYTDEASPKLDERRLAEDLGVSRTPIREALSRLEQEGLVQNIPRRGAFVVRKTKKEILEIICVWGALEGMAARMATVRASDEEIAELRELFATFKDPEGASAQIDEYSNKNITFHQAIIKLCKCDLLVDIAEGLFLHMRPVLSRTISEGQRLTNSIVDHMYIIEVLEKRDADLSETYVREHTNELKEHVNHHVDWLK
jgi:DNA-binding GntR family transcriptional regulator